MTRRVRFTARPPALLLATALAAGGVPRAEAEALSIDHDAVACIVAGRFPRLDACFAPGSDVARARVHFRARGTPHWYFVDMSAPGECRSVLLPKPLPTTAGIDYYVSAVGRTFSESRSRDFTPRVVRSESACDRDALVAAGTGAAVVLLGVVGGAPPVPPGFDAEGIVGAGPGGGAPPTGRQQQGGGGGFGLLLGLAAIGGGGYFLYQQLQDEAAPPDPNAPFDGEWEGTTSQQRPLTLTIAGSALTRFQTSVQLGSGAAFTPIQRGFAPGVPLARGAFTFQQAEPPLVVTGTLDPSGVADGRIETSGREIVTWRARRLR